MPTIETSGSPPLNITIDEIDQDLIPITWTRRGKFAYNPQYGLLHRIIASRAHNGRSLTNNDIVVFVNDNHEDCRRGNLKIVDRGDFAVVVRKRVTSREFPQFVNVLTYIPVSNKWRVEADGTIHETERAAMTHLASLHT